MNEVQTNTFDYSLVNDELAEFLKEQDLKLLGLHSKYSREVGKVLYEAQQKFANYNNGGLFEKWYTSRGFKKSNVYNYIQIFNEVQRLESDRLEIFENLPQRLKIEVSKRSVNHELKEKVLSGDITTHKEFKEMERKLKVAEQQAEHLERELQAEREKEPKVIEKTVEKVVDRTDYEKIEQLNGEIKTLKQSLKEVVSQQDYKKLKQELDKKDEELLALTRTQLIEKDRYLIRQNVSYLTRDIGSWMRKIRFDIHERGHIEGDKEVNEVIEACVKTLEETINEMKGWTNIKENRGVIDADFSVVD